MNYLILAILFIISGFFMKYSDDLFDVNHNLKLASIFSLVCGLASGLATVGDSGAAYIFIAILVGNLIVLKVDGIHHLISLIVFVVICLIWGIPNIYLPILFVCILAAILDEVGHELLTNDNNMFIALFFEYRFVMKIVVFLLAIFGAFDILIFIYFILFELSYVVSGLVFEKLNIKN